MRMEKEEHKKYHRRLIYLFLVIMILLFGGATFYYYVEGWRYIDALYFVSTTMTTVGYGDITPNTDLGKIFTIIYVFAGVGMALYGLSVIAAHFVEVREEFWLERLANIKAYYPKTFWGKIKSFFNNNPGKSAKAYEESEKK